MICLARKVASFLKAYRVYSALASAGALGRAILCAACGRLGHVPLGKTPVLLREKHIV
jgi:hypothetical protein